MKDIEIITIGGQSEHFMIEGTISFKNEGEEILMENLRISLEEWFNTFKQKKCECGSEKAKVAGHSIWCPKFKD